MKLSDDFEPDVFEMIFNNAFLTKISHFKKKVLTEGFKDHIALSYDDVLSELIILSRLTGDMISPLSGENKLKIQIQDNNYFENNYPFLSAPGAADEKKFERNLAELTILGDANQKAKKWHCIYPDNRIDRWQSVTFKDH